MATTTLPSGTITLLFTDIQGSTQLWDAFPDEMRAALSVHDRLVTEAVTGAGGAVVKHTGDGIFAAFDDASAAIGAAIDAQTSIAGYEWDAAVGTLEVRMALHTDELEAVEGDYHGPAVNRTARIEAAGHGGQVLLSDATSRALTGLPDGVELIDLGSHRLRGLTRPEQIHQLVVPGLRSVFPQLRTVSVAAGRLPDFATSFVGRSDDLESLVGMISDPECRVVTALGPGGIGKTRLAVEAARLAADRLGKVGHFVPLAAVTSSNGIVREIGESLDFVVDFHSSASVDDITQVLDMLAVQQMVLVLDNFEQLVDSADVVARIASSAPDLTVVVTSRRRLGIGSEWIYEVGGLEVADGGATADATALFIDRARRAGARSEDLDAAEIAALCQALGGMPLAIELAAAWAPTLSVSEISSEVGRDLGLLGRSAPDVPERHRSVRAAFDHSWRRLPDDLRSAFARLAVFGAPFTREAAREVAGAELPTLLELMNRSMLRRADLDTYDLHPLLKGFGLEQLEDRPSVEEAHARFYLDRLLAREPQLQGSIEQIEVKDEVAAELPNLRQATVWAVEHLPASETSDVLQALHPFYFLHGWVEAVDHFGEIAERVEAIVDGDPLEDERYLWAQTLATTYLASLGDLERAGHALEELLPAWEARGGAGLTGCLVNLGVVLEERGDLEGARELFERAAGLGFHGDHVMEIMNVAWYGWVLYEQGDVDGAEVVFRKGLALAEERHSHTGRAYLLSKLGVAADALGRHQEAADYHHEGREIFVKIGDLGGQGYTLSRLSWTYWLMGDFAKAKRYGEEGLAMFEEINHRWGIAASWCRIGLADLGLGDVAAARRAFVTGLDLAMANEMGSVVLYALMGLGRVLAAEGRTREAVRLQSFGVAAPQNPYREMVQEALDELDADEADLAAGAAMSLEEAIASARGGTPSE